MEATQIWQAALDRIRSQIDLVKFNTWFSGTSALSLDDGILAVKVPSPFVQACLEARYSELVCEAVGKDVTVRFCDGRSDVNPMQPTLENRLVS